MGNKLQRIFNPNIEEQNEIKRTIKLLHDKFKDEKGCTTCRNCVHVKNYPGFVTGEECICCAGLECDTVLFSVKNCPMWKDSFKED